MCGRINVSDHLGIQELLNWFEIPLFPEKFQARYNIAPGATLITVANIDHNSISVMNWGMIPVWAKENQFTRPLINARAESIWDKPSFKNLIRDRRAIIPINGFYEWQRHGKSKKAFYIHSPDKQALALGAIYQINAEGLMECCIVTTSANQPMGEVHNRMPVILDPESMNDWLFTQDKPQLDHLMLPPSNDSVSIKRVSDYVNNAQHEGPECVEPPDKQNELF